MHLFVIFLSIFVRIAWLYLVKLDLQEAIEKITTGTKEYVENLGVTDKYHRTITEATARIMNLKMARLKNMSFDLFLQHNRDLVDDLKSLISKHYSEHAIQSNEARVNFVPPDKREFE